MSRLSMNEMTTLRWTFEEDVAHYAAAGFTAIGAWREKVVDCGEQKAAVLLTEHGLQLSNLLWCGGFTGTDGRTFAESVEDAREAIELAARLQSPCVVVYTGSRGIHTHNHSRRLVVGALKELAVAAADAGVDLALEPMNQGCAAEWTFLTSLDDALAVLDQVDHPRVKLAFDTYHLGFEHDLLERIEELGKRIAIVHVGDGREPPSREQNRCLLGDGVLPLGELISALVNSGYDGPFDIELMGEDVEPVAYEELLSRSRHALETLLPTHA